MNEAKPVSYVQAVKPEWLAIPIWHTLCNCIVTFITQNVYWCFNQQCTDLVSDGCLWTEHLPRSHVSSCGLPGFSFLQFVPNKQMRSVLTSSAGYGNTHTLFSLYFVCLFFIQNNTVSIQVCSRYDSGDAPEPSSLVFDCMQVLGWEELSWAGLSVSSCYPRSCSIRSLLVCAQTYTKRNTKFKHPCSNSASYSFLINRHVFNYCLALCASPSFVAAYKPVVTHLCCLTSLSVSYKLSIKPLWNLCNRKKNIFMHNTLKVNFSHKACFKSFIRVSLTLGRYGRAEP